MYVYVCVCIYIYIYIYIYIHNTSRVGACACVCVCACAWAPAHGMTHLDWAVLYLGMRACYIRLRSGWGSDGNVYIVLRGLRDFWKPCCGLALKAG